MPPLMLRTMSFSSVLFPLPFGPARKRACLLLCDCSCAACETRVHAAPLYCLDTGSRWGRHITHQATQEVHMRIEKHLPVIKK